MFYRFVRSVVAFALGLFYRIEVTRGVEDLSGPVMFVGNHPNSIIDPAMVFVITNRQVTFLAKEPLFRTPVFGWLLKARAADALGNTAEAKRDYQAFMRNYDSELAKKRPEYTEHSQMLQDTRSRAQKAGAAAGGS